MLARGRNKKKNPRRKKRNDNVRNKRKRKSRREMDTEGNANSVVVLLPRGVLLLSSFRCSVSRKKRRRSTRRTAMAKHRLPPLGLDPRSLGRRPNILAS